MSSAPTGEKPNAAAIMQHSIAQACIELQAVEMQGVRVRHDSQRIATSEASAVIAPGILDAQICQPERNPCTNGVAQEGLAAAGENAWRMTRRSGRVVYLG